TLEHGGDQSGAGSGGGVGAEDLRSTLIGPGQAHHHLHGGGLAGAVGPEQGEDLAGPDGQVHAVQGADGAVALMDPTQADRGGGAGGGGPGGGGLGGGGVEGGPVLGGRVAWGGGRRDHDIHGSVRACPIPGTAITAHP